MYISTKGGQTKDKDNKYKSLKSLLSIIQFTMAVPKGYSKVYEQFFDILIKANSIQLKLFDKNSNVKNDSMAKYKKYLETKIYSFLHSIVPLKASNTHSSFPSLIKNQAQDSKKSHQQYYTQSMIHNFKKKTVEKEDKPLNTSDSIKGSFRRTPSLVNSSRLPSSTIDIRDGNHIPTQCNNYQSEEMKVYLKVAHPMIKTKYYSSTSSSFRDSALPSSFIAKSKSILKKHRMKNTNSQSKKNSVTFNDEKPIKTLKNK